MIYKYDRESDILAVTLSKKPFDYAQELGDFVVHFDKKNKPVYVEILNASAFLSKATQTLSKSTQQKFFRSEHVA